MDIKYLKEILQNGMAHIENGNDPVLVFEDGGVVKLPKELCEELPSMDVDTPFKITQHRDVCGSINAIRTLLIDESIIRLYPESITRHLDDVYYMFTRMENRHLNYLEFTARVKDLPLPQYSKDNINCVFRNSSVYKDINDLTILITQSGTKDLQVIVELAEKIRDAATALQNELAVFRNRAIEIHKFYKDIKGTRDWSDYEDNTDTTTG